MSTCPPAVSSVADLERIESQPYREFIGHGSVLQALTAVAARYPERRALTYIESADPDAPPRRWTYAALLQQVRRAANLFHALAGDEAPRIAMLLPAIPEAHFTLWGGEAAGIVCPINYLLNSEHIAALLRVADVNILVTLGPHPELDIWTKASPLRGMCPRLRHVLAVGGAEGALDFGEALATMDGERLAFTRDVDAQMPAALFHTGGTTGAPKLARHTHGNQLHAARSAALMYASTERDVMLNGFPLFHVAGAFVFGLSTLLAGGEVVLPTLLGMRNAAFVQRYWQFVERHHVTLLAAVPTVIATLLGTEAGDADRSSVRALLTGGSPLPTELAAGFESRFGIPVRNILGMTESAGVVSIEPFHAPRTPGSCGLRLPYTRVEAVAEDGTPCTPGETGILRLQGPNVSPGYVDPRHDTGTFTAGGWLVSGDIGHVDAEGRIFITGRSKDLIIRSSHNIDPGVIESALLRHPDVQMAAAVGEPDEYAGELPVAFVALRPGAQVDAAGLLRFVEPHIAERPALPKRIDVLPSIPVTAVGKVYKPALRGLALERAIRERVCRAGLGGQVNVGLVERPSGWLVRFVPCAGADGPAVEAGVRRLMAPFPIAFEFQQDTP